MVLADVVAMSEHRCATAGVCPTDGRTAMNQIAEKQKILLESGTNELEVLVFSVGSTCYGVNVAKVREIIGQVKVVHVPMAHSAVIGVFKLRDSVIPLVDLRLYFGVGNASGATQRTVIFMEFNDIQMGFLVDGVDRIFRLNWSKVRPMPMGQEERGAIVTSACEIEGKFVLMPDFEKIVFEIQGSVDVFRVSGEVCEDSRAGRGVQRILLAEDSPTIRKAIESNWSGRGTFT